MNHTLSLIASDEYDVCLKYERSFAHPLHRIMYCDITGDGIYELIVLSTAGIHVLQVSQTYSLILVVFLFIALLLSV